jgi:hypothetical protein
MMSRVILASLLLVGGLRAADEEPAPKTNIRDVLRARAAEEAKKKPAAPATAPAPPTAKSEAEKKAEPEPAPTPAPKPAAESAKPTTAKDAAKQPATVMPKVEVKRDRITVLDQKLAKQEEDIAREKKNTQPSEVDLALNDSKIAKPLAIFGGESAQFRKRVSSERVELMEAEKDLIEAIARAKTKKEKEELQKQLDELRTVRRELEKALR